MKLKNMTDEEKVSFFAGLMDRVETGLHTDGLIIKKNKSWLSSVRTGVVANFMEMPFTLWNGGISPILTAVWDLIKSLIRFVIVVLIIFLVIPIAALLGWVTFDEEKAKVRRASRLLMKLI